MLNNRKIRNVLAVIAGYALWTVIFIAGGAALRALRPDVHDADGITSDTSTLLMYLAVSIVASLAGGFVTASLADKLKMLCACILAVLLLATGIPVQLTVGSQLPLWYNLAFLVLLVPVTVAGAMLGGARQNEPAMVK